MLKVENTNDYIYLYRLSISMLPCRKGWLSIANDTKKTSEYELILWKDFFTKSCAAIIGDIGAESAMLNFSLDCQLESRCNFNFIL